ncbi:hypothetical protein T265_09301 [Opisthorchis viverrini]|uniref:Uncharacterized protein n=1 Tax=Opisthorchis viverrini TaxID=6198 RepID=A0A074Z6E2_OPIVI|nr:hypothetical protein T265_09301 [Opisthorchis viverrini]KER22638.1 hypothetical protein T265_09301 [Opisthorchis viverrini]
MSVLYTGRLMIQLTRYSRYRGRHSLPGSLNVMFYLNLNCTKLVGYTDCYSYLVLTGHSNETRVCDVLLQTC